ncbi:MAG: hypothetical protein OQK32_05600 [Gammaproteobacteria bacterium]|nr:hypothetical protein [Gammaproteobacteria bacterium]MCW8922745.1 hypothetical protein [Gammaproteobacteria bacterium]
MKSAILERYARTDTNKQRVAFQLDKGLAEFKHRFFRKTEQ